MSFIVYAKYITTLCSSTGLSCVWCTYVRVVIPIIFLYGIYKLICLLKFQYKIIQPIFLLVNYIPLFNFNSCYVPYF